MKTKMRMTMNMKMKINQDQDENSDKNENNNVLLDLHCITGQIVCDPLSQSEMLCTCQLCPTMSIGCEIQATGAVDFFTSGGGAFYPLWHKSENCQKKTILTIFVLAF